jgi:hypothetical protein
MLGRTGASSTLGLVATGPVAILAGFSLSAVVTNLGIENTKRNVLLDVAALCLSCTVVLLLMALRLLIAAQRWVATPAQILDLWPEATLDAEQLQKARDLQHRHVLLYNENQRRGGRFAALGIWSALAGLSCWTFGASHGRAVLVAAGGALAIGAVIAALEYVDRPYWLFPDEVGWARSIARRRPPRSTAMRRRSANDNAEQQLSAILGAAPMSVASARLLLRLHDPHLSGTANVPALVALAMRHGKAVLLLEVLSGPLSKVPHIAVEPWRVRMMSDHNRPQRDATTFSIHPPSLKEPSLFVVRYDAEGNLTTSFAYLGGPTPPLPSSGGVCEVCTAAKRKLVAQLKSAADAAISEAGSTGAPESG